MLSMLKENEFNYLELLRIQIFPDPDPGRLDL